MFSVLNQIMSVSCAQQVAEDGEEVGCAVLSAPFFKKKQFVSD